MTALARKSKKKFSVYDFRSPARVLFESETHREPLSQSGVNKSNAMRQIISTTLCHHPGYRRGVCVVTFDDHSRILVDISSARRLKERSPSIIKSAAFSYSTSHPHGILETIVIDLLGQRLNCARNVKSASVGNRSMTLFGSTRHARCKRPVPKQEDSRGSCRRHTELDERGFRYVKDVEHKSPAMAGIVGSDYSAAFAPGASGIPSLVAMAVAFSSASESRSDALGTSNDASMRFPGLFIR
jgi:hypothetical protein